MAEKNFLVLGGAGKSGTHVVKQALEMGHKVTAYARSTTSLKEHHGDAIENQKLTLIECDIISLRARISPMFASFDAIISVLGPNSLGYQGTEVAQLYRWILDNLRESPAVERRPYLLVLSTQSIVDPNDRFDIFTKIHIFFIMAIAPGARRETLAIRDVFKDEVHSHKDDVDWTVCRLNLLKDTGLPLEGGKAGYVAKDGWLSTMDRTQLAYWLVKEAEKPLAQREWVRKMPALWGDNKVSLPGSML